MSLRIAALTAIAMIAFAANSVIGRLALIEGEIGAGVTIDRDFAVGNPCFADLAEPFGTLDLADISAFVTAFTNQQPLADLAPDGLFDLADITVFVNSFTAGCP